jgi:hypothetical protein
MRCRRLNIKVSIPNVGIAVTIPNVVALVFGAFRLVPSYGNAEFMWLGKPRLRIEA